MKDYVNADEFMSDFGACQFPTLPKEEDDKQKKRDGEKELWGWNKKYKKIMKRKKKQLFSEFFRLLSPPASPFDLDHPPSTSLHIPSRAFSRPHRQQRQRRVMEPPEIHCSMYPTITIITITNIFFLFYSSWCTHYHLVSLNFPSRASCTPLPYMIFDTQ